MSAIAALELLMTLLVVSSNMPLLVDFPKHFLSTYIFFLQFLVLSLPFNGVSYHCDVPIFVVMFVGHLLLLVLNRLRSLLNSGFALGSHIMSTNVWHLPKEILCWHHGDFFMGEGHTMACVILVSLACIPNSFKVSIVQFEGLHSLF